LVATQQSTLERFRRVARNHRLPEVQDKLDASREIEWLRSRLNGKIYRNAENWAVPSWVLRGSRRSAATPSGDDTLDNDQQRYWTTVGGVGSHDYAVCDSKGLLTAIPECGSIDFWLLGPTGIIFPSMISEEGPKLTLLSAEDQVYEWRTSLGPVEFSRLVYHSSEENNEAIYNEIQIRNISLERAKLTFYVAVRPMSVKGMEPIETAEYNQSKKTVYTNGLFAMRMAREPKSVYMTMADNPELATVITPPAPRLDAVFNASNGLATVVVRFDVLLKPAGTERFFFACPLSRFTKSDPAPALLMDSRARDSAVQSWFEFMDSSLGGEFPDRDLTPALSQSKAIVAMQIRSSLLQEGAGGSDLPWPEKSRLLLALCRCNCLTLAKEISLETIRNMDQDVLTDISAAAPLLWSVLQVFEYSRDASYLREVQRLLSQVLPGIVDSAESFLGPAMSDRPSRESMPAAEMEDGTGWPDTTERDDVVSLGLPDSNKASQVSQMVEKPLLGRLSDFTAAVWTVEALRSAASVYKHLGDEKQSKPVAEVLARYSAFVQESSKELAGRVAGQQPKAVLPEEEVLDGVILLGTVAFLRTKSIDSQLLEYAQGEITQRWTTILRMVRLPGVAKEHSTHLTLLMANYLVHTKDRSGAAPMMRAALKFLSEYYALPDWVDPKTNGGSRGSGCSVVAAADLMLLLRDMIVSEDGDDLVIMPGIPQEWYTSNNNLVLRSIPTPRGRIQIEMGASANQRQIEIRMDSLPREIEAYLPTARAVSMVKLYGGGLASKFANSASPHVRLVPLSEDVVLAFHR